MSSIVHLVAVLLQHAEMVHSLIHLSYFTVTFIKFMQCEGNTNRKLLQEFHSSHSVQNVWELQ